MKGKEIQGPLKLASILHKITFHSKFTSSDPRHKRTRASIFNFTGSASRDRF